MTHSFALPLSGPITGSLFYFLDPYVNGYTDEEGLWHEPVNVDNTYIPVATEATGFATA